MSLHDENFLLRAIIIKYSYIYISMFSQVVKQLQKRWNFVFDTISHKLWFKKKNEEISLQRMTNKKNTVFSDSIKSKCTRIFFSLSSAFEKKNFDKK